VIGMSDNPPLILRLPFAVWYILLAVALGLVGARYLALDAPKVWITKKDLPAFHRLTEQDLEVRTLRLESLKGNTIPSSVPVVGRYTLFKVSKGQTLSNNQLGPALKGLVIENSALMGIQLPASSLLSGRLERGDIIKIILAPKQSQGDKVSPTVIENVVVLDMEKTVPTRTAVSVVVGVPQSKQAVLLANMASSNIAIIRTATAS
jgi:Flp pilus assembly protein CpaB